jgi:hypothetical protein
VRAVACGAEIVEIGELGRGEYDCEELVVDLLVALAHAHREERQLWLYGGSLSRCSYHEHEGGECYAVKREWMHG